MTTNNKRYRKIKDTKEQTKLYKQQIDFMTELSKPYNNSTEKNINDKV